MKTRKMKKSLFFNFTKTNHRIIESLQNRRTSKPSLSFESNSCAYIYLLFEFLSTQIIFISRNEIMPLSLLTRIRLMRMRDCFYRNCELYVSGSVWESVNASRKIVNSMWRVECVADMCQLNGVASKDNPQRVLPTVNGCAHYWANQCAHFWAPWNWLKMRNCNIFFS